MPVTESRQIVAALQQAGASPRYTEYEGVAHNSWDRAFAEPELPKWLLAQRRNGRGTRYDALPLAASRAARGAPAARAFRLHQPLQRIQQRRPTAGAASRRAGRPIG